MTRPTPVPTEADVEAAIRELAALSPRKTEAALDQLARRQPALVGYAMGGLEDASEAAQGLGLQLLLEIDRAFAVAGAVPRTITEDELLRTGEDLESSLGRLSGAHDQFFARAAEVLSGPQPNLFRHAVGMIMNASEDPEDPLELSSEDEGSLFFVFACVITALDRYGFGPPGPTVEAEEDEDDGEEADEDDGLETSR